MQNYCILFVGVWYAIHATLGEIRHLAVKINIPFSVWWKEVNVILLDLKQMVEVDKSCRSGEYSHL